MGDTSQFAHAVINKWSYAEEKKERGREGEAISGHGTKAFSVNSQFEDLTVPLDCLGTTGMGGGINFRYYRAAG